MKIHPETWYRLRWLGDGKRTPRQWAGIKFDAEGVSVPMRGHDIRIRRLAKRPAWVALFAWLPQPDSTSRVVDLPTSGGGASPSVSPPDPPSAEPEPEPEPVPQDEPAPAPVSEPEAATTEEAAPTDYYPPRRKRR